MTGRGVSYHHICVLISANQLRADNTNSKNLELYSSYTHQKANPGFDRMGKVLAG